jgi:ribosomal protein S12 methylthiotransferase
MPKTVSIISLGCFRNSYDSQVALQKYLDQGYVFKPDAESCDLLLINTCGFVDKAKKESIDTIKDALSLKKLNKIKQVLVMGCLAKRYEKELKKFFPLVDFWQGALDVSKAVRVKNTILPKHLAFLKICEGCVNRCSYCAIPLIKGPLKSRPRNELIDEARFLNIQGIKELNLIGQDITSYGKDLKGKTDLAGLVKNILKVTPNIPWIRLIYAHPKHLSDSVIDLIAHDARICKYIDLPIQHASDKILKAMNRHITQKEIYTLIEKLRRRIPGCVIRTSVIVGFPGESESDFKTLMRFLADVKFERLGAFIYSREEGTPAYDFKNQLHHKVKQRRLDVLMRQQQEIAFNANQRFVGRTLDVLIEENEPTVSLGRSQHEAYEVDGLIYLPKGLTPGKFVKADIIECLGYDFKAKLTA